MKWTSVILTIEQQVVEWISVILPMEQQVVEWISFILPMEQHAGCGMDFSYFSLHMFGISYTYIALQFIIVLVCILSVLYNNTILFLNEFMCEVTFLSYYTLFIGIVYKFQ